MEDLTKRWADKPASEIEAEVDRLTEAIVGFNKPDYSRDWKVDPDRLARQMGGLRGLFFGLFKDRALSILNESSGTLVLHPANEVTVQEAVMAAAFPKITAALIASKVLEGYNEPKLIGDNLVTTMPSKRRMETLVGFTEPGALEEVHEGASYTETGIGEKYVTTKAKKWGRLIALTAEAIMEDQTGQLLIRAKRLGKEARILREKIILGCILDLTGWAWYSPNGSSTAVYGAGNTVSSNALVDWTDVDAARAKLAGQTDDNGNPIFAPNAGILVPDALWAKAMYILHSVQKGEVRAASAVHIIGGGGAKEFVPIADVYSSPFLDLAAFGNSLTTWYYGSFKDAFVYQEIWPIQVMTRAGDSEAKWLRDIDMEFKVRLYGGAACVDNKYVIKCTA